MDDDLGVALGAEDMAERGELGDQLLVVVDLAVVDDDDTSILVPQRLLARREIDDGQPLVAEADSRFDVQAFFVRAAMTLRFVHAQEEAAVDRPLA